MIKTNHQKFTLQYHDSISGTVTSIGDLLMPVELVLSLDSTESPLVTLRVYTKSNQREFVIKTTDLANVNDLNKILLRNAYFFNPFYGYAMQDYIITGIQRLQTSKNIRYIHHSLGFYQWNDTILFLMDINGLPSGECSSFHDESFDFKRGSTDEYERFLKNQILPFKETQLALVLGLSSVISSHLKDYADVPTLVLNMNGASSTGKTTAAMFIASLWASPAVGNHRLTRTFNATVNSLMASIEGINGVPIILDDATAGSIANKTSLLYTLAQGEPKGRANGEGKLVESGSPWSGLILITSETPLLNEAETRQGLVARVIDTNDMVWTQSAEHSERIKQTISEHYGFVGQRFVEEFFKLSDEEIKNIFNVCKQTITASMKNKDGLSARISNKLALLLATAVLTVQLLGYDLDIEYITRTLVNFDQQDVEERHIGERAHQAIKLYISSNYGQFVVLNKRGEYLEGSNKAIKGHIQYLNDDLIMVTMPSDHVKSILHVSKIFEYKPVLAYWKENKLIKTGEQGRCTVKDSRLQVKTVKFIFTKGDDILIPWYSKDQATISNQFKPIVHFVHDESTVSEAFDDGGPYDHSN